MRTSTAELFQAIGAPADSLTLERLLESTKGEVLTLTMALDLGAAVAERVGAIHASGRTLGAFDASRVVCTRDGRVLLSKDGAAALAPELKRGEPASAAADVYAVGFLIYQLLTGKTPAQASAEEEVSRLREVPPPSRFNAKVDGELDAVVLAALRVEPSERPASVLALQAALDGICEELELVPEPEAIGALVAKLLDAPPPPAVKPEPVPEPRPSPGAAVATSKLQTAFSREAPLFPGRAAPPPPAVQPEALTTSRFEPWLPASEPAPAPEAVPAGRTTQTEPLLALAEIAARTPMSREELAKTTPVVTAQFVPKPVEEPVMKDTVPIRAPRNVSSTPAPLPTTSQALSLAEAVQLVEEPAPAASVLVSPSLEMRAVAAPSPTAERSEDPSWNGQDGGRRPGEGVPKSAGSRETITTHERERTQPFTPALKSFERAAVTMPERESVAPVPPPLKAVAATTSPDRDRTQQFAPALSSPEPVTMPERESVAHVPPPPKAVAAAQTLQFAPALSSPEPVTMPERESVAHVPPPPKAIDREITPHVDKTAHDKTLQLSPATATPERDHTMQMAPAVAVSEPADDSVADKWLRSPGAETFIDADYDDESAAEPLVTPGFIAGASTAGFVLFCALVLALLTPSNSAPTPVTSSDSQPVRHRTVRPVEAAPVAKPAERSAVVAKAVPAAAAPKKKAAVKWAPKQHASNPRHVSP